MEALSNNNIFNFSGLGAILAFFGAQASNFLDLVRFNPLVTFAIGIFSLIFIVMRVYLAYLEVKKVKKELKD